MCETTTVADTTATATAAHPCYDISDRDWEIVAPYLPGSPGRVGRPAQDNRRFINAVFWILRTGAPWRDLPPEYGHWNTTHRCFTRWQQKEHWARLLTEVSDDPDLEWLMIDASQAKCIRTAPAPRSAIRPLAAPKGAEYQDAPGGGRSRDAGSYGGHGGDSSQLHTSGGAD